MINAETAQYIKENINSDPHQLSLQRNSNSLIDFPLALRQITGIQKIRHKVPTFFNKEEILYPIKLSLEQSSSEITAHFKSTICEGSSIVDLTGGFGVDSYFLSRGFEKLTYVERNEELCELAKHNFKVLGAKNIEVVKAFSEDYLQQMAKVDWIYVDPARRNTSGRKVILLSDCEPNVAELSPLLLQKANNVLIKLSPMMDITAALKEMAYCSALYILAVENECKEILLKLDHKATDDCRITTINFSKNRELQQYDFTYKQEIEANAIYVDAINKYLYEPNAALMKAGAFKLISNKLNVSKLHINSHLYSSDKLLLEFPGRIFEVIKTWGNSKQELKTLAQTHSKANISVRNFPLSVEEIRKKLKLKDGGDVYLFATTLANNQKVIIECRKTIEQL